MAQKSTGDGMEKDLCRAIIILIELQMGYISSALEYAHVMHQQYSGVN
jgi:hypothetical protein